MQNPTTKLSYPACLRSIQTEMQNNMVYVKDQRQDNFAIKIKQTRSIRFLLYCLVFSFILNIDYTLQQRPLLFTVNFIKIYLIQIEL